MAKLRGIFDLKEKLEEEGIDIDCDCDGLNVVWMGVGEGTIGHERRRVIAKNCVCDIDDERFDLKVNHADLKQESI